MRRVAPVLLLVLSLAAAAFAVRKIEATAITPRQLAPYIERRAQGHNPVILGVGHALAGFLNRLDRADPPFHAVGPSGAAAVAANRDGRYSESVAVATPEQLLIALAAARPGQEILLLPGRYPIRRAAIPVVRPGSPSRPIVVRADRPGTALLELDTVEGFRVSAPYWTFENLVIRGTCGHTGNCEHAFHVVGNGRHFVARNNTISDFNAQFKINGEAGHMPDDGLIENNTLRNRTIRDTDHPVTPIDLVAASGWRIRHNLIADFVKGGADRVSYGGFAKGAGFDNRFEQNIVVCEDRLRGAPGQRVGLSLGGGGTGRAYCRDHRCITEQERSAIVANLVMSCSDDGIYLNRSARSSVAHNTVLDTAGIVVRFAESSAEVDGNLVDGPLSGQQGAIVDASDNITTSLTRLYLGLHPVRRLFAAGSLADLGWRGEPPRRREVATAAPDLCGSKRPRRPAYGAFEDFRACLRGSGNQREASQSSTQ